MTNFEYNDTQDLPILMNKSLYKNNNFSQNLNNKETVDLLTENIKKNYNSIENIQHIISKNDIKYTKIFKKLENENKEHQNSIETLNINILDIQNLCKNITEFTIMINDKLSQYDIETDDIGSEVSLNISDTGVDDIGSEVSI